MFPWVTSSQLWELVPASIGAVIGAAAAAIPAYLLARKASKEVLERDIIQRKFEDKTRAFRIFTVLTTLSNSVLTLRGMIEDMLLREVPEGEETPNQRRISAVVGFAEERLEKFSSDDLALLARSNDQDLVIDLITFSSAHGAICSSFAEYRKIKAKNHDLMSGGAEHRFLKDDVVETVITNRELIAKIRITDRQLESMIIQVINMVREESISTIKLASRFNYAMDNLFPKDQRPQMVMNEAKRRFPDLKTQ